MDRTQRESVIIQSLLLQIPEIRKLTIDRLYSAGLNGMSALFAASAGDIAATAGIPHRLAERIVEKFQSYRKDLGAASQDITRAQERSAIDALVSDLAAQNDEFEKAATLWTIEATEEKKRLRRARERTLMQISVLLARLGEVGKLREIEKLPFARKLDFLRAYLKEAQEKYVAST
jgi:hypothetical protein